MLEMGGEKNETKKKNFFKRGSLVLHLLIKEKNTSEKTLL